MANYFSDKHFEKVLFIVLVYTVEDQPNVLRIDTWYELCWIDMILQEMFSLC